MDHHAGCEIKEKLSGTCTCGAVPPEAITCPRCQGGRTSVAHISGARGNYFDPKFPCSLCDAVGTVSAQVAEWFRLGAIHRRARVEAQVSLMVCSVLMGISPSELSAMECGRADPAGLVGSEFLSA